MDTRNNADVNLLKYKDFDSLEEQSREADWDLKNKGHNYHDDLIQRSTSRYLQRNPNMVEFFPYLNKLLSFLIDRVKYIRNFNNYAVDRDYKNIN